MSEHEHIQNVSGEHSHTGPDGKIYTHSHEHPNIFDDKGNVHAHVHEHTQTKSVINRLARAIGHLESVKRMVENGRDCPEVLIQLAAVRSAINNTAKVILKDHIEHCIIDAVSSGDYAELEELNKAIEQLMK